MMARFDKIAACSDGCRRVFGSVLPELLKNCVTVRNCHLFDEIKEMASDDPITYMCTYVNVVIVSRLSPEKGIDRAMKALAVALEKGLQIKFHIVGGGSMGDKLMETAADMGVADYVIFYGEQSNPYRYMKNADLLLLPSYHEAAPMVIDEARCLGLPVLATRTTSSDEMVIDEECGWVCENTDEALAEALCDIAADKTQLSVVKDRLLSREADNSRALAQFDALIEN
jgi:glycosyltransferase involved in cell wall biosynthesis